MKKIVVIIMITISLIGLSSCYTATFNPLGDEDEIIYESEDKTVRLEIAMKMSYGVGRLYVLLDDQTYSFMIEYIIIQEYMDVYINSPQLENSIFILDVTFDDINFFKKDYDTMHLNSTTRTINQNAEHDIFKNFDVTLNRINDSEVKPLNYFNNQWHTEDNSIVFVNDKMDAYYSKIIHGTMNDENIWISFMDSTFVIWSKDDLQMKLSGSFEYDNKNIILEPFEGYDNYPDSIILVFDYLSNA